ncbi:GNAT family N-acetyltransferase [Clostridium zeae]|uniref:GNAT family N-acetyltransferase n=1 Tax=Clostridium zeae TaxID=2759022 RepID=A0ABQ1E629_9CLOT|nr:GNAT family N-acetyltransferase [Clostridium zeae]GFZ30190.1 GNAT family N-acetyltransferase [Clostridium zeae]
MEIFDFELKHVEEAKLIAISNYNEEREYVKVLPEIYTFPDLEHFANNGLGVVAFDNGRMVGFLCCYEPWESAYNSKAKGTFSPIHAHGTVKENRCRVYRKMYEAAAEKWVKNKITYHSIALYAHDQEAVNAMFTYGFGLRCIDAIRPMEGLEIQCNNEVIFEELSKAEIPKVREMRKLLTEHLGHSPCFMYSTQEVFERWLTRAEARNTRLFVAIDEEKPIAFVEIAGGGENFATEVPDMCNICGAFCLPEYRGKNIYQSLLNFTILKLKEEGYNRLGVDFESFNPNANMFWTKYFTSYTNGVVRRIDECALNN